MMLSQVVHDLEDNNQDLDHTDKQCWVLNHKMSLVIIQCTVQTSIQIQTIQQMIKPNKKSIELPEELREYKDFQGSKEEQTEYKT